MYVRLLVVFLVKDPYRSVRAESYQSPLPHMDCSCDLCFIQTLCCIQEDLDLQVFTNIYEHMFCGALRNGY